MAKILLQKGIKSILAGFLIGMAGSLFIIAKSQGFKFLPAILFPIGLFLICVFKLDLFTGKVGYLFNKEKNINISDLLIMLLGNLVGAFLFGAIFTAIFYNNNSISQAAIDVVNTRFGLLDWKTSGLVLLKSSLCGVLVYIAVFLFAKVDNFVGKVFAVFIPIATFVYLGLDHSIANMFYMSMLNSYSLNGLALILVAIVGNSIGAILFDLCVQFISKEIKKKE